MGHARIFRLFALVLCACAAHPPSAAPGRAPQREAAEKVRLLGADADVWAFETTVELVASPSRGEMRCVVRAGEREYAARASSTPGRFTATIALVPGDNAIQARCRVADRVAVFSQVLHDRVRLSAGPRARARLVSRGTDGWLLDGSDSEVNASTRAPLREASWWQRTPAGELRELGAGPSLALADPGSATYELHISDALGQTDVARVSARDMQPELQRSIVYGVLPTLYPHDHDESPLTAARGALDELRDLGVTTLWLAPSFAPAPPDDFGYAVRDYFAVRSDFGTPAELQGFIEEAHRLGLRVLLDLPANHTAREHPYFAQTEVFGRTSHYFSFYVRDRAGHATHYFDWANLPNLDYEQHEVARFMREAGLYWVQRFDVDGYRLDAAWGVRQRSPEFWPLFIGELRRVRPDAMLIAEASARDPYYQRELFAAAYDWTGELGHASWRDVFAAGPGIARRLAEALDDTSAQPSAARPRVLRFLNNNDTGARFVTRHGVAMTRVATAALLTLPGVPCLYAGDEWGAEYEPYQLTGPVQGTNSALRAFHQQLIQLRRQHAALHGEGYTRLYAGTRDEALVYLRTAPGDLALVALNFSDQATRVQLPLQAAGWSAGFALDLMSGARHALRDGALVMSLGPWDARVVVPAEPALTPRGGRSAAPRRSRAPAVGGAPN